MSNYPNDTGAAKLPGLPVLQTNDPALRIWAQAVTEHLELRAGARGNKLERAVTLRELEEFKSNSQRFSRNLAPGSLAISLGNGMAAAIPIDKIADAILNSRAFQRLDQKLDDPTRFDDLAAEVRAALLSDLAAEATKLGADIVRVEKKLQTETKSLALVMDQVTASVNEAKAGVREVAFTSADANRAQAGQITQITARLDDVGGATLEQAMLATADRIDGLSAEYMVKVSAGGAVAGFGLSASEDPDGLNQSSSFLVQADKFAVVMPGLSTSVPFGVDASGAYINGSLRITGGTTTLADLTSETGLNIQGSSQFFKVNSAGVADNSTVALSVQLTGAIAGETGDVTWARSSSSTTALPSPAPAPATYTINAADQTVDAVTYTASITVASVVYEDSFTVVRLRDGGSALTGFLTNESHGVASAADGTAVNYTGADGTFMVYLGSTRLTSATTPAVSFALKSGGNPQGLTHTIDATTGVYSVTGGMATDAATLTLVATIGASTVEKVFTLAKNRQGVAGGDGADGSSGDAVDIVFVRAAAQPATPTASAGVPTAPITWYSDVASVPAGANPMWSSVGKKVPPATNYTWGVPVRVDGTAVAEVTIYRRSASAPATPTGGTYTFSTTPSISVPASWSSSVPAGTDPVYTSRAVVSAPAGYTSAVSITGWTAPVVSLQNGAKGDTGAASTVPGPTGVRGTIVTKISGAWSDSGASSQIYSITSASGAMPTTPIKGDIVYYSGGAKEFSGSAWGAVAAYIDGSMVITGTLAADKISAGTINAAVSLNSEGYGKFAGNTGALAAGIGNVEATVYAGATSASVGFNIRAGVVGYAVSPSNASKSNLGVIGYATGAGSIGVYGIGDIYGVWAQNFGGVALHVDGTSELSGNASVTGAITATGNITAYGSSDIRLKKNIKPIKAPLSKIDKLRGVSFDWRNKFIKDSGGEDGYFVRKHDVGVIAQEVREVQPEIVGERKDGTLAVKYEKLVPLLIEAIKELHEKVKRLEAR